MKPENIKTASPRRLPRVDITLTSFLKTYEPFNELCEIASNNPPPIEPCFTPKRCEMLSKYIRRIYAVAHARNSDPQPFVLSYAIFYQKAAGLLGHQTAVDFIESLKPTDSGVSGSDRTPDHTFTPKTL